MNEKTLILYHGSCPDGFGAAYAAWKKLGNAAEYRELHRNEDATDSDYAGRDLVFVDFCYDQPTMDRIVAEAKSVVVLDHHKGAEDIVRSMPQFIFDADRSGATIAWDYFHPGVAVPELLKYIEDDDLYRFALPDTRGMLAYFGVHPFTFEFWDETAALLAESESREKLLEKCRAYAEYFMLFAQLAVEKANLVHFEGVDCYFATTHPYKPMKSLVGNLLARKKPPFALVVTAHPKGYGVSIRGDGSVDVSKVAAKYGGSGHPSSSGFAIPADGPLPWTFIEKEHEDTRD